MKDHVKVRLEYVRLVRAGKLEEAQEVLEFIWGRKPKPSANKIPEPIVSETKVVEEISEEPKIIKESKFSSLNDLVLIKGIGNKTVKDIITMFVDLESLKAALILDKVALRDDIVKKLKENLL